MKILTLNTWQERGPWQERWEVAFHGIEQYRPDILAFQEVFNPDWTKEIQKRTGHSFLVFAPEPSGLMILTHCRVFQWKCLTMKTKSPTEDYLRYALFAELDIDHGRWFIFNTHLSWHAEESEIRQRQVKELLLFIEENAAGQKNVIVTGDFNALPGMPEIAAMTEKGGFTDSFGMLHPEIPGFTWDNRNPYAHGSNPVMPDRRIDYIFIRSAAQKLVQNVEIILRDPNEKGIYASDHFGVLAEVRTSQS